MEKFIQAWLSHRETWWEVASVFLIYGAARFWRTGRIQRLFGGQKPVTAFRLFGAWEETRGDALLMLGSIVIYTFLVAAHKVGWL